MRMKSRPAAMLFLLLGCALSLAQGNKAPEAQPSGAAGSSYVTVHKFDPERDAAADIQAAIAEAQRTGKRIIVDIVRKGGKYDPDKMKEFLTKWSPSADKSAAQND